MHFFLFRTQIVCIIRRNICLSTEEILLECGATNVSLRSNNLLSLTECSSNVFNDFNSKHIAVSENIHIFAVQSANTDITSRTYNDKTL